MNISIKPFCWDFWPALPNCDHTLDITPNLNLDFNVWASCFTFFLAGVGSVANWIFDDAWVFFES